MYADRETASPLRAQRYCSLLDGRQRLSSRLTMLRTNMVVASTLITMLFTTPTHAFVKMPRVIGPSPHAPAIHMTSILETLKDLPRQMHNKRHRLGEYASRGTDVIWISYTEAIFGTTLIVNACTGHEIIDLRMPDVPWVELKVTVPPGTQPGDTINASNIEPLYETETARAFKRNETARGFKRSWYFEVQVQIPHPTELDEKELGFLQRIATMDALSARPVRRITANEKRGWRETYRSSSALRRLRGGETPDSDTDVEARTLPGRIIRVLSWTMVVFCSVFLLAALSVQFILHGVEDGPHFGEMAARKPFWGLEILHEDRVFFHGSLAVSIVFAYSTFGLALLSECGSYLKHRRTMIQPKLPDATRSSSALS